MSIFFMMVGLPYSGKSVYAEGLREKFGAEIHSSDAIRAEILGNVQDQTNNQIVFDTLHKRVISDLSAGKNVIYDATNINYKRPIDLPRVSSEMHSGLTAYCTSLEIGPHTENKTVSEGLYRYGDTFSRM